MKFATTDGRNWVPLAGQPPPTTHLKRILSTAPQELEERLAFQEVYQSALRPPASPVRCPEASYGYEREDDELAGEVYWDNFWKRSFAGRL